MNAYEFYVGTDVDTEGPIPGMRSMPSFASSIVAPDEDEAAGTRSACAKWT